MIISRQFLLFSSFLARHLLFVVFVVKKHPKLKSRYKTHVQVAAEYMKTIDDFDDLVDPKTLARHYLGPKPSPFVLHGINIEETSEFSFEFSPSFPSLSLSLSLSYICILFGHAEMMKKFNQKMYARMKAKTNKPLSTLGKKVVRVVEKGTPITPTTSIPEATRMASPANSLEELTPRPKRQRTLAKGKEKVVSQTSSVWDDAGLALARAHSAVTAKDLKALSSVPSYMVVSHHIHKLVQVRPFLFGCVTHKAK